MYFITEDNRLVKLPSTVPRLTEDGAMFLILQKEEQELAHLTEQALYDPCI